jgi:hypothetical protein
MDLILSLLLVSFTAASGKAGRLAFPSLISRLQSATNMPRQPEGFANHTPFVKACSAGERIVAS